MTTEDQGIKELREAHDRAVAERDQIAAEFKTFQATVTFKEAGLTQKHAELYLRANPDGEVTPDAVKSFAEEYGLAPQVAPPANPDSGHLPADGSPPPVERTLADGPQTPPVDRSLASLAGAGGTPEAQAAQAAPARMDRREFESLLKENPEAAAQAYREGRVQRHERNVQADQLVAKGEINR